jgi:hypothetical protein
MSDQEGASVPAASAEKRLAQNEADESKGDKKARPNNWARDANPPGASRRIPKKKIALLLSFCGTNYQGMQMYVPFVT